MTELSIERRRGTTDRRNRTLAAYLHGALNPRRVRGRRASDRIYPVIDWHSPRVLALAFAILALSTADGVLTVALLDHGAIEINPFMALFVPHSLGWFAAVKLGLTSICLAVLVACSPMRLMRAIPGELLLYLVLGCYIVLISHELEMLGRIT
jgi:hypothetical protein